MNRYPGQQEFKAAAGGGGADDPAGDKLTLERTLYDD